MREKELTVRRSVPLTGGHCLYPASSPVPGSTWFCFESVLGIQAAENEMETRTTGQFGYPAVLDIIRWVFTVGGSTVQLRGVLWPGSVSGMWFKTSGQFRSFGPAASRVQIGYG
ncbi:hypothetical protein Hanom_Chr12g01126611 [Helianthus anomalus]